MQKLIFTAIFVLLSHFLFAQDTTIYQGAIEQMPRWPGCETAADEKSAQNCWNENYNEFLNKNLTYPSTCEHFSGTLFIEFVVEIDGSINDVKVLKGDGGRLDEEVIKMYSLLPQLMPAKHNGKIVKYRFTMPLRILVK